jgi:hypothetical protein
MSNTVVAVGTANAAIVQGNPSAAPALRAPSSVTATVSGPTSVLVTWRPALGASAYQVLRATNGGTLTLVAHVASGSAASGVPDYLGGFLKSGTGQVSAQYAVKAEDSTGAATAATMSNVVTIAAKSAAGSTSTSYNRAVATSAGSVTLTWSPPVGSVPCTLQRMVGGGSYTTLKSLATGAWQYVDSTAGLAAMKPLYQMVCGGAKSSPTVLSFPPPY